MFNLQQSLSQWYHTEKIYEFEHFKSKFNDHNDNYMNLNE